MEERLLLFLEISHLPYCKQLAKRATFLGKHSSSGIWHTVSDGEQEERYRANEQLESGWNKPADLLGIEV